MLAARGSRPTRRFLLALGAAALVGQAILLACGRRRWSRLAPGGRPRGALPAGAGGRCGCRAEGRRRRSSRSRWRGRARALPTCSAESSDSGRDALRPTGAVALAAAVAGLAAVHRRAALRDPRHRAQPRHVPASARGRPARERRQRAADRRRRIRSARTRSSSRSRRSARTPCMRSTGSIAGDGGRHLPGGACAARAPRACAADRPGRSCVGFAYLLAVELRPGRVQGDDRGAVRARLRGRARRARRAAGRRAAALGPRPLRALPLAVLAIGAPTPTASPGCSGSAGRSRSGRLARAGARRRRAALRRRAARRGWRAPTAFAALALLAIALAPEVGRMVDFASFETFDPAGVGARQPLRPAVAAGGARDLALGRLPGRAGRRRGSGGRLLPRRGAGARRRSPTGCAGGWRARRAGRPGRRSPPRRAVALCAGRRDALSGGQGAGARSRRWRC